MKKVRRLHRSSGAATCVAVFYSPLRGQGRRLQVIDERKMQWMCRQEQAGESVALYTRGKRGVLQVL